MRQDYGAFHFSPDYGQLFAINQILASQTSTVVLSVNYRSGTGYGRLFRNCLPNNDCGWRGGSEYSDIRASWSYLSSLSSLVDHNSIGIHGLSYGGLNCLQALARDSPKFRAGVANAPVLNHVSLARFYSGADTGTYGGHFDFQPRLTAAALAAGLATGPEPALASPSWIEQASVNTALAWKSSPAAALSNLSSFTSPLLLIHGDADHNVDVQESLSLARSLRQRASSSAQSSNRLSREYKHIGGSPELHLETMMLVDEKHWPAVYETQRRVALATVDFLYRFLVGNPNGM